MADRHFCQIRNAFCEQRKVGNGQVVAGIDRKALHLGGIGRQPPPGRSSPASPFSPAASTASRSPPSPPSAPSPHSEAWLSFSAGPGSPSARHSPPPSQPRPTPARKIRNHRPTEKSAKGERKTECGRYIALLNVRYRVRPRGFPPRGRSAAGMFTDVLRLTPLGA